MKMPIGQAPRTVAMGLELEHFAKRPRANANGAPRHQGKQPGHQPHGEQEKKEPTSVIH